MACPTPREPLSSPGDPSQLVFSASSPKFRGQVVSCPPLLLLHLRFCLSAAAERSWARSSGAWSALRSEAPRPAAPPSSSSTRGPSARAPASPPPTCSATPYRDLPEPGDPSKKDFLLLRRFPTSIKKFLFRALSILSGQILALLSFLIGYFPGLPLT